MSSCSACFRDREESHEGALRGEDGLQYTAGAQTERRGGAGPVRGLLGGKDLTGGFTYSRRSGGLVAEQFARHPLPIQLLVPPRRIPYFHFSASAVAGGGGE